MAQGGPALRGAGDPGGGVGGALRRVGRRVRPGAGRV